jgi:hypothetical protein
LGFDSSEKGREEINLLGKAEIRLSVKIMYLTFLIESSPPDCTYQEFFTFHLNKIQ